MSEQHLKAWLSGEVKDESGATHALSVSSSHAGARAANAEADSAVSQPFAEGGNPSDPNVTGPDLFKNPKNHVDAVSSILTYCSTQTGFVPLTNSIKEAAQKYNAYVGKVSTFPGFTLNFSRATSSRETSIDVQLMIKQIKEAYEGVLTVDVTKLTKSIEDMANSVLSQKVSEKSDNLFNQVVLKKDSSSDKVNISIFNTVLYMKKEQSGKTTYSEQSYSVGRAVWIVNATYLAAYADTLANRILKKPLDDWLEDNSTPTGAGLKTCFTK